MAPVFEDLMLEGNLSLGYAVGLVEKNDKRNDDANNNNNNNNNDDNYLAPTFQIRLCVLHILPSILLIIVQ